MSKYFETPLTPRERDRIGRLVKRAGYLEDRIIEGEEHGRTHQVLRAELSALLWAIDRLSPGHVDALLKRQDARSRSVTKGLGGE